MKRLLTIFTAVLILVAIVTRAQIQTSPKMRSQVLSGQVLDEKSKPLPYATISLLRLKDSSAIKTTMTDSLGSYTFKNFPAGNYFIAASITGYDGKNTPALTVSEVEGSGQVPTLKLAINRKSLAVVTVTAKKSFIERKIDRTVINVESSSIAAGSTAMEVLEKAPGVIVDKDGNIAMSGKSGVLVMIDGKQTYMSAGDLAQLLRTMQSSQLEAIELITNPSAKYDAAGNAGIINIKTKKIKTVGTNGTITIGSGYGNKYKGNAGISLNHRTEKMNLFGNYNFGTIYRDRILEIDRVSSLNNQNTYFKQHQLEDRHYGNNNFKAGADFFINSRNTLGILISGY
jgi:outer membrane receptor protein involved in Fe transport